MLFADDREEHITKSRECNSYSSDHICLNHGADAHANQDECGAPEFYTAGAKLVQLPGKAAIRRNAQIIDCVISACDLGQYLLNVEPINQI